MTSSTPQELDPEDSLDAWLLDAMRASSVPVNANGSVLAHVIERHAWLEVRAVLASEPRVPGDVGRWLDTLPHDRTVVVAAVVSTRLAGMLQRRGFRQQVWWDKQVMRFDHGAWIRGGWF